MHKWSTDGHAVEAKPAMIEIGSVLRGFSASNRPTMGEEEGVPAFSDCVVIGISSDMPVDSSFPTLISAFKALKDNPVRMYFSDEMCLNHTQVRLARPYLQADSIGGCFNALIGMEYFTISAKRLMENYRMVENSDGKPAMSGGVR